MLDRFRSTVLLAVAVAGCAAGGPPDDPGTGPCAPVELTVLTGPLEAEAVVSVPRGAGVPVLAWISTNGAPAELRVLRTTAATTLDALDGDNATFHAGRLEPADAGEGPFEVVADAPADRDCPQPRAAWRGRLTTGAASPESVQPGRGVHVHTAGFWTNGTLFYTNMDRVHNGTGIPKGELGPYEGGAALKVYVYDNDRSEMPPHWEAAGYFTTIEGFNAALRTLREGAAGFVVIPPEEAYTVRGREDHPLYGDSLAFYIEIDRVVAVPCLGTPADPCDLHVPPAVGQGPA